MEYVLPSNYEFTSDRAPFKLAFLSQRQRVKTELEKEVKQ